jgi:tRNA A-37 threonylcarbamoyl transferase component Bud32
MERKLVEEDSSPDASSENADTEPTDTAEPVDPDATLATNRPHRGPLSTGAATTTPSTAPTGDPKGLFIGGRLLNGRYRHVELLGEGGMGAVYLVEDALLRRKIALKTLHSILDDGGLELERFRREVAITHTIHHPNVSRTYDIGEHGGVHYITMEALEGETLMDRLRAGRLYSCDELRDLMDRVCQGLNAAHQAGIVHRDLKPANIMLVTDDRGAVLMDFGIAGQFGERAGPAAQADTAQTMGLWNVTSAGQGTPAYMAPEQWDENTGDARTDIYALGVIMYVCLAGRAPFEADTLVDLEVRHRVADPSDAVSQIKNIDSDIASLICACLAKDPDGRPQSIVEVIGQLRRRRRIHGYIKSMLATATATAMTVILVYLGVFSFAKTSVIQEVRPAVTRLARLIARDVHIADIARIDTPEDMNTPAFKRVFGTLARYAAEDTEIKDAYIMRKTSQRHALTIVADSDSEPVDENRNGVIDPGEQGAKPGTPYDASSVPAMLATFETGKPQSDEDFIVDPWGMTISGYAPVVDDPDGAHLVGVDMTNAQLGKLRTQLKTLLAVLAGLVVAGIGLLLWPLAGGDNRLTRLLHRAPSDHGPTG